MMRETTPLMRAIQWRRDRKSTRLNSSHLVISYAVFCLKKKNNGNTVCNDDIGHYRLGVFELVHQLYRRRRQSNLFHAIAQWPVQNHYVIVIVSAPDRDD